jgi:release factor glutamine methyltransferase
MAQAEPWTIGRLLNWTQDYLKQHGSESPRLDAEVLLASARGCQRIELYTSFTDEAPEAVRTKFRELVKRRSEGTPVAYLVGKREFYSLPFAVTPDVLIPRPETELLVIKALDHIKECKKQEGAEPLRVIDIGTGSGIVAVVLAKHSDSRITAVDISAAALAVAQKNAADLGVAEKIEFVESDLFAAIPTAANFHLVVSNPPYIREAEMDSLARDVRDYEPRLALAAGPTGMTVIERLVPQAAERLTVGGMLMTEISPMIDARVRDFITADGRFELLPTVKDLAGHARVIVARRKG